MAALIRGFLISFTLLPLWTATIQLDINSANWVYGALLIRASHRSTVFLRWDFELFNRGRSILFVMLYLHVARNVISIRLCPPRVECYSSLALTNEASNRGCKIYRYI